MLREIAKWLKLCRQNFAKAKKFSLFLKNFLIFGCSMLIGQRLMNSFLSICLSVRPSITKFSQGWIIRPKMRFFTILLKLDHVFLKFGCHDSLQQCLTSSRGKTHEKIFRAQIWAKQTKTRPEVSFFCYFLKFQSLVFLDIAQDLSLGQCLTYSRPETSKRNFGTN